MRNLSIISFPLDIVPLHELPSKKEEVGMTQRNTRDPALDLWVETRFYRRSRSKRFAVGAYTKYPNKALLALSDMEIPYCILRREDLKYIVSAYGYEELADSWEDIAYAACLLMFRVVEGDQWPHYLELSDADKDQ